MRWGKVGQYSEKSSCGAYSVCAIGRDATHAGFWEAWRTRAHVDGPHLIATNLDTLESARRACEEDHAT